MKQDWKTVAAILLVLVLLIGILAEPVYLCEF